MNSNLARSLAAALVAAIALFVPAWGALPPSCESGPCNLESEYVYFLAGNPTYQINAIFTGCTYCSAPGPGGEFDIDATLRLEFGPYDPASPCAAVPDSEAMQISISTSLQPYDPGGDVVYYYPTDPNEVFEAWPIAQSLKTECVDASRLDYTIPYLSITDIDGAMTETSISSGTATMLTLPENVRSSYGSSFAMPQFKITQRLTFDIVGTLGPTSDFRFWPEGLPFRLGPYEFDFTEDQVSWNFDPVLGPPPYEVVSPDPSNLVADGYEVVQCYDPEPGVPCTSTDVWNAGYLDTTDWTPNDAQFDIDGLDVTLELGAGTEVVYQTLFPQGMRIRLNGMAGMHVVDSEIHDGQFDDGDLWLQLREGMGWCEQVYNQKFDLYDGSSFNPRITRGGGIVAGVFDLNPVVNSVHQNVKWMKSEAVSLECGTFYVPPVVNDVLSGTDLVGPQHEWLRSAEAADAPWIFADPVKGRGIYAGLNYNRNKLCTEGSPGQIGEFCGVDADCGPAGLCQEDLWSPRCPAIPTDGFHPRWVTRFQDNYLTYEIHPEQMGREMAFYQRASGVTGVFDWGDQLIEITQPFEMEFNSFGHAFRASLSEWSDTIIRGGLKFEWPSYTSIPFNDMTMCNCGSAKAAGSGEPPTENRLAYWDATFYPFGLSFLANPTDDCADAATTSCNDAVATASAVCVEATMPIPHFTPTPTVRFRVEPNGNADQIVPMDTPIFEFDAVIPPGPALASYEYAAEQFQLNDWVLAGMPTKEEVSEPPQTEPYGYFDSEGDITLPVFGSVPAGIKVRSLDGFHTYDVDLHEEGDPEDVDNAPYIEVTKKAAAGELDLSYRVDYFRPDSTADPNDGANENGRGLMLGYSGLVDGDRNLDLGSIKIPSTVIMTPDAIVTDVGAAASMRLWGATEGEGRDQLADILPGENLNTTAQNTYQDGLNVLVGTHGWDPWALPVPDDWYIGQLYETGAMEHLRWHPTDNVRAYNTQGSPDDPGMNATNLTGFITLANDEIENVFLDANLDTNGNFFAMDRSTLTVDRHVKTASPPQPIAQIGRRSQPGNMALPGEMSVPFPNVPGLQWDFEFDFAQSPPSFVSLTGSLDLTKGGLSGIGFDRAGMTLKYWNDGDWYFDAGLELKFNGYRAFGDVLLGNTKTMEPLWAKDPTVADFLSGIDAFRGGYIRVGASGRIFDYTCMLRVAAGFEVGGWYISNNFGAKLRGWVSGKGACLVSVRGDLTLMGSEIGDKFKMEGFMWVGGGIGFCDEEDWDTPEDVLDDGACASCVLSGSIIGITPPKFKLSMEGPDCDCSL